MLLGREAAPRAVPTVLEETLVFPEVGKRQTDSSGNSCSKSALVDYLQPPSGSRMAFAGEIDEDANTQRG